MYSQRQSAFATSWQSIQGDDEFARDERMDLRHLAMNSPELAEVYLDLTGFPPEAGEVTSDTWAIGRKGIRARLHGGVIRGHAGPAQPVFRAILDLNEAVVARANRRLPKPHVQVTDSLREKLGLWGMAPQPGSVIIELVAPPAEFSEQQRPVSGQADAPFPRLGELQTPTESSIDDVFSALGAVLEFRETPLELEDRLIGLGSDAIRHLSHFAQRCEELAAIIDLDNRVDPSAAVKFTPSDAAYLRATIRTLHLDEQDIILEGMWRTASHVRGVFDLEVTLDDGSIDRISGVVPKHLISDSATAFNKYVQIQFRETRKGTEGERIHRTLERVSILGEVEPRPNRET